ncbi:DEAD/DEAH box helicase [Rugamonas sp. FT107W]|uniref:DEAD/DEAH box helicase n=1 Tax=Duganella vulcania TaxID=2692166 RepID=A0A845HHS2_9BURK|nr:DEAD/DEAH box helicase [Duganella vulcania]MYN17125.1 DEAD/DEAH box helicase [Duganella vulcania]
MANFSVLPESFELMRQNVPPGFFLSERLIDAVVLIKKERDRSIARLAGVVKRTGKIEYVAAPSNRHCWIIDGTTIRPLPNDVVEIFAKTIGSADINDLSYLNVVELLRNCKMLAVTEEGFLKPGYEAAETFGGQLVIPGLRATLFPYQAKGVQWMWTTIHNTGGLILADEMGLGKTLQIISLLLLDKLSPQSPALIVCPTSLIANWQREIERFSVDLSVMVHRGNQRTGTFRGLQTSQIVITTYETLVNDISIFSAFKWSWVICDEAQAIKNPKSGRRIAISGIPRKRSISVTGTPVENSLLDLWSLVDFVIPGLLGSLSDFERFYDDDLKSAHNLSLLTDPIILKRRVLDVAADLPERINIDIPIELDRNLIDYYLHVKKTTIANYPFAGALVATLQLQLVCAHPWLRQAREKNNDNEAEIFRSDSFSLITNKMERAISILKEAFFTNKKILVFSIFNHLGDLLKEACQPEEIIFWSAINGGTPQGERQEIIDRFSSHSGAGCLILNPKAAGSGLNITAATVVLHFTPVWNPALEAQASARAHRRGQTQPVTIYRLFYKDTVEEVMIERALWKSELANESIPLSSRDDGDYRRVLEITPKIL